MARLICFSFALLVTQSLLADEPFVPGTGEVVSICGDDFEDTRWGYIKNGAKASHEDDEQQRPPGGKSRNGRWYESALRGQPDVVKRVPTPPAGLPGSSAAACRLPRASLTAICSSTARTCAAYCPIEM